MSILKDKKYFNDINYTRKFYDKYIIYRGVKYTKTELSRILSEEFDLNKETIRKKITLGWSIKKIKNEKNK